MTAAERMHIVAALGRPVLTASDAVRAELNERGTASAHVWRTFLQALMEGAGDAMSSPIGIAIQLAILGKIQGATNGNDDASERHRGRPSADFPVY